MDNAREIRDLFGLINEAYKEKRYLDLADFYEEYLIRRGLKIGCEHTYFLDLTEDLTIKIPKPVIAEMEIDDEPCLISKPFDDMISFTKMYDGATVEELEKQGDVYSLILEMIEFPKDGMWKLRKEWIDMIDLQVGDLVLLSSSDESFTIKKFDISAEVFVD